MLDKYGEFWKYLSQAQRDLIMEGEYMMNDVIKEHEFHFKDYSFIVFPFAKAYEGFLKKLFLDIRFISRLDYISDHLRLGKLMSPNLALRLGGRSLYSQVKQSAGTELADEIWTTWKTGRNQIFHYFPHNLRAIDFEEAEDIVNQIVKTMEKSFEELKLANTVQKLKKYI